MIMADSLDPRDGVVERNSKLVKELEIEEVKLFDESNLRSIRIGKNLFESFK